MATLCFRNLCGEMWRTTKGLRPRPFACHNADVLTEMAVNAGLSGSHGDNLLRFSISAAGPGTTSSSSERISSSHYE
ncbi:Unknown protein sequence [Pseudomonas syringae pv. maculicola]|nr:Unknown protein sequence [Pseudomonas syringae pv. maculicola]